MEEKNNGPYEYDLVLDDTGNIVIKRSDGVIIESLPSLDFDKNGILRHADNEDGEWAADSIKKDKKSSVKSLQEKFDKMKEVF